MEAFLTLKDHVYIYIAEQISGGKLIPGEKITKTAFLKD